MIGSTVCQKPSPDLGGRWPNEVRSDEGCYIIDMLPFEDTEKEKLYLRREHIILSATAPSDVRLFYFALMIIDGEYFSQLLQCHFR